MCRTCSNEKGAIGAFTCLGSIVVTMCVFRVILSNMAGELQQLQLLWVILIVFIFIMFILKGRRPEAVTVFSYWYHFC